jgi:hypothetical protein
MSKKLFKKSKWYHKFIGLLLIIFLIEMSISGILLNHKDLISPIDMPHFLVPSNYEIKNFNRASIIDLIETENSIFIAGKKGIFKAQKKEVLEFKPLFNGLSNYTIKRKSYDLEIFKDDIYAATENGLYKIHKNSNTWKRIEIGDNSPIKKIIKKDENNLFIISTSNIYLLNLENIELKTHISKPNKFTIRKITPRKEGEKIVTAIELFFHLHDGRLWGLFGRLLFDLMGLAIIFLSISAFYIWFIPKRIVKRKGSLVKNRKKFRFFHKYHSKIGIYSFFIVIIISFTAIFMRPPFIIAITDVYLPRWVYPASVSENRWENRIENALYDKSRNKLMIQTSEYLWEWNIQNDDFTKKAYKSEQKWPLFIMGATYLEIDENNNYIIGSFSGLYRFYPNDNKYENLVKNSDKYSRIRPNKQAMLAGAFKYDNKIYIATHLEGLKDINGKSVKLFEQPKIINEIKMPLWNWNFELHNGRILRFLIGKYYILLVPFSALMFFFVLLTGLYDWIFVYKRKK